MSDKSLLLEKGMSFAELGDVYGFLVQNQITDTVVLVQKKQSFVVHDFGPDAEFMDCIAVGAAVTNAATQVLKLALVLPE